MIPELIGENAYMMIKRKNQTIFLNAKKNKRVNELKMMIGGIIKTSPENIQLYYNDEILEGKSTLSDYFDFSCCVRHVTIGLALKINNENFEPLDIVPLSNAV